MSLKKVVAIFGMPRSGTSFVAQILDSSPKVAFRMEPIFSYKLKNMVNEHSTKKQFIDFFKLAFNSDEDEFMNQMKYRNSGIYPSFNKQKPDILVIKTTRYHEIIPSLLKKFNASELKIISIVRNPCGAINSWLKHPNEFPADANPLTEWRTGTCRKNANEEYWGFDDWKSVTKLHLSMEAVYSNFKIIQYEDIVDQIELKTKDIFNYCGLSLTDQTSIFIQEAQSKHIEDPYSVFKSKQVAINWKTALNEEIINCIINEITGTELEKFLV